MREIREANELFFLTVITGLVGSYVYHGLGLNNGDFMVSLLYSQFILVAPTLIYVLTSKVNIKERFRYHKIKIGTVLMAFVFAFLIMPLMQEINLISMLFAKNETSSKIFSITEGRPFLVSALVIAVIPAFFEESVYRGCFFHAYSKKSPMKAIFLSALFFGLMHLNFNQFSYAFAMGMIFCFLVEGTGSIFTSMIVHFTINCSSVVMVYVEPILAKVLNGKNSVGANAFNTDVANIPKKVLLLAILFYGVVACFTTALAIGLYVLMVKHEGRWEHLKLMFARRKEPRERESFITFPMVVAILICLTYMVYGEMV